VTFLPSKATPNLSQTTSISHAPLLTSEASEIFTNTGFVDSSGVIVSDTTFEISLPLSCAVAVKVNV